MNVEIGLYDRASTDINNNLIIENATGKVVLQRSVVNRLAYELIMHSYPAYCPRPKEEFASAVNRLIERLELDKPWSVSTPQF